MVYNCFKIVLANQYNMAAAAMIQNMASMYNQPASYQMSSYIPDAHKIAQAIFASVGWIVLNY